MSKTEKSDTPLKMKSCTRRKETGKKHIIYTRGMQYIVYDSKTHVGKIELVSGYVTDFWVRALAR